jgi:hypothetical protein
MTSSHFALALSICRASAVAMLSATAACRTGPGTTAAPPVAATQPAAVIDMTIEQLGNFDFDENHPVIPDRVKALNGVMIRLRGYMLPIDQSEHITRFALIPAPINYQGGSSTPGLPNTIVVNTPEGRPVDYSDGEISVEGKLAVGFVRDDGFIIQIFAIDNATVKPIAP